MTRDCIAQILTKLSRDSQAGQRIDGGRFTSGIGGANG
jgi:hypothetical protein